MLDSHQVQCQIEAKSKNSFENPPPKKQKSADYFDPIQSFESDQFAVPKPFKGSSVEEAVDSIPDGPGSDIGEDPSEEESEESDDASEEVDAVQDERLLDDELLNMQREAISTEVKFKRVRHIKPAKFQAVETYSKYRDQETKRLRRALFETMMLSASYWVELWRSQPASIFFALKMAVKSLGVLVQSKTDKTDLKWLTSRCSFTPASQKLKRTMLLIYQDNSMENLDMKYIWSVIMYLSKQRPPAITAKSIKDFFSGTAVLTANPDGTKTFLTQKQIDQSLVNLLTVSLERAAKRFTTQSFYTPVNEYFGFNKSAGMWEVMDRELAEHSGIVWAYQQ